MFLDVWIPPVSLFLNESELQTYIDQSENCILTAQITEWQAWPGLQKILPSHMLIQQVPIGAP